MPQQSGFTKAGVGIMVMATVGCLILLLSFGGMMVTSNFANGPIAIWYTAATLVCLLSLVGKIVCGFGPSWLASTTMLVFSIIFDLLLGATIVCFSIGVTIPGVEEQIHHLATACLFVATTYCIICWLKQMAENAGATHVMQNTIRADWLFKSAMITATGIVVAISIDSNVKSVTGIIAMVLAAACVVMMAGCIILQTTAMIGLIGELRRTSKRSA